jgi:arabinoxylan arabinofuranohydrolase
MILAVSATLGRRIAAALAFAALAMGSSASFADNPIVQTNYTADPAPMVYDGRLYLYTSHDEDVTVNNFFTMNDWRLYSTVDMVNWTDHGSPASYRTFSWGTGDAWAPHGAARNGKFYLYVPINNSTGSKLGVAVANSPIGPFTDALGKALVATGSGNIDPNVFIDDDGMAYLYWGNPNLYYVKLNADMISFPGSPTQTNLTTAGFGARSNTDRATAYEEGPWFYKRGSLYYLVYPADGTPEKISYTTSSGPLGPWMYRGDIMAKETGAGASFTNHPGVIDYKGKSYFFYHNAALPGGGGYKRSVCVEEFTYGADGTIPTIRMSTTGPTALGTLNAFQQVEAETIAFSSGLKTEVCSEGGIDVTQISNGDYIKVKGVDFGTGAVSFEARVASAASGGNIELHLDSQTGTLLGTCAVPGTGGAQTWMTKSCAVSGATGVHDLYLKFTGGSGASLFNFNWWKFTPRDAPDGGAPDGGMVDGGVGGRGGGGGTTGTSGRGGAGGASGGSAGTSGGGRGGGAGGQSPGAGGSVGGASSGGGTGAAGNAGGRGGATATGGVSGIAGTGGASTAGGGGSNAGTAGSGAAGTSGAAGAAGADVTGDSAGCGCRTSPGEDLASPVVMLLLVAATLRRARRGPRQLGRANIS